MASVQGLGPGVSEIRSSPPELEITSMRSNIWSYVIIKLTWRSLIRES